MPDLPEGQARRASLRRWPLVALVALAVGGAVSAALAAPVAGGTRQAVISGTFMMRARVTVAVNVRGEHAGERIRRVWVITGTGCGSLGCARLRVRRALGAGREATVWLAARRSGVYEGRGSFFVALRCLGRVDRHGSRVPYTLTLWVTRSVLVGSIPYATVIGARYLNRSRTDMTRCPLGPSHDAGVYTGTLRSALPAPPPATGTTTTTTLTGPTGTSPATTTAPPATNTTPAPTPTPAPTTGTLTTPPGG